MVVHVEHQGRDAQHHMISASYLWLQLNFGGFEEHQKLEQVGKNATKSWFETWDPSEYFSISNMIQMSSFTNEKGFPTHHFHINCSYNGPSVGPNPTQTVVLAPHSRADCLAWNESATRPPGCHTCHASVERWKKSLRVGWFRNPEASI